MTDVKTEVFECPSCCDQKDPQLLQDISMQQALIEKLKLWVGTIPLELGKEGRENSAEIIQNLKRWLKHSPTEFAWWTEEVSAKAESESLLIILESHGELKDPGEGLEIQQNDEDSFNFHAESLNQDYAGVDPLSLDFDTGNTIEDYDTFSRCHRKGPVKTKNDIDNLDLDHNLDVDVDLDVEDVDDDVEEHNEKYERPKRIIKKNYPRPIAIESNNKKKIRKSCRECDIIFKTKELYQRHLKTCKQKKRVFRVVCKTCNTNFKTSKYNKEAEVHKRFCKKAK